MKSRYISWSRGLREKFSRMTEISVEDKKEVVVSYRPFSKQISYFGRALIENMSRLPKFFPENRSSNLGIMIPVGKSAANFSALVSDTPPVLTPNGGNQFFALYAYDELAGQGDDLLSLVEQGSSQGRYRRRDNITDATLKSYRSTYFDEDIDKEDIFFYVYGLLHSSTYKEKYASDLAKMMPRIPKVKDFWGFSVAGRELAELHLNYESVEPYQLQEIVKSEVPDAYEMYRVQKLAFLGRKDKTGIVYNSNVTLKGIPAEALEYQVNGKSALEWIIDRYQVTVHKDSQIRNDPNDYSREVENPRYIIDLIKRIVTVSLETNRIVASLPELEIIE
ncbi:type ISP restriction/modification enzyme [Glutamicibacter arilaitensis]|uniref:type ISP restriction/modification enzyme n=1 Tax=Glutamicibacter arilaitensis TaxID=256701 RepID=UPI003FCF0633